jgi:tRNA(adenine34) deaminase
MDAALEEAKNALLKQEVPIGAVVVKGESIVGRGHNRIEERKDPTAHAEILALRQAGEALGDWRLQECRIYVTVEPCIMCLGAILTARIPEIVYALHEPKSGAVRSKAGCIGIWSGRNLRVVEGVRKSEAMALLQDFFALVRNKN